MQVIPAVDLLNGQVVRLHKGSFQEVTIYRQNPLELTSEFYKAGFKHIHVVDLNGAKEGRFVNLSHIQGFIKELNFSVQTGGGIRTYKDVKALIQVGVSKIICSSMAVKNEPDWLQALSEHPDKMILGMDLKDGKIAYGGWLETAEEEVESFLTRMIEHGLREVLCTDISKDGTLAGPNLELYVWLKKRFPEIKLIASGGVSCKQDLVELSEAGIDAVVVGKAFYEEKITLEEMMEVHKEPILD